MKSVFHKIKIPDNNCIAVLTFWGNPLSTFLGFSTISLGFDDNLVIQMSKTFF